MTNGAQVWLSSSVLVTAVQTDKASWTRTRTVARGWERSWNMAAVSDAARPTSPGPQQRRLAADETHLFPAHRLSLGGPARGCPGGSCGACLRRSPTQAFRRLIFNSAWNQSPVTCSQFWLFGAAGNAVKMGGS